MPDDPKPYDLSRPFDVDELMDGFTVEERQVPVDPDLPLGRAMAAARGVGGAGVPADRPRHVHGRADLRRVGRRGSVSLTGRWGNLPARCWCRLRPGGSRHGCR
jgi:hypothetical protein